MAKPRQRARRRKTHWRKKTTRPPPRGGWGPVAQARRRGVPSERGDCGPWPTQGVALGWYAMPRLGHPWIPLQGEGTTNGHLLPGYGSVPHGEGTSGKDEKLGKEGLTVREMAGQGCEDVVVKDRNELSCPLAGGNRRRGILAVFSFLPHPFPLSASHVFAFLQCFLVPRGGAVRRRFDLGGVAGVGGGSGGEQPEGGAAGGDVAGRYHLRRRGGHGDGAGELADFG